MSKKHTPGPWSYRVDKEKVTGPDGFPVASVETMPVLSDWHKLGIIHWSDAPGRAYKYRPAVEANANGYVLAAAPDLLAACEAAEEVIGALIGMYGDSGAGLVLKEVSAAICKAKNKIG